MSIADWAEMHGELNMVEKEVIKETTEEYGFFINEHVDYQVLVSIRIFDDGTRICEVDGEFLAIFNDDGDIVESFEVTLPSKYINEALEKAEDYE